MVAYFCPPCGSFAAVSPNPAKTELTVTFTENSDAAKQGKEPVEFQLYDMQQGRALKKWTMAGGQKTYKLNISGTPKGLYILHIKKGQNQETHKIAVE